MIQPLHTVVCCCRDKGFLNRDLMTSIDVLTDEPLYEKEYFSPTETNSNK